LRVSWGVKHWDFDAEWLYLKPFLMHWTTVVPLGLCVLHVAIAPDEDTVTHVARIAALALAMEAMSNCSLHGVSILLAAPTIAALAVGVGFETLHAVAAQQSDAARKAARRRWTTLQRDHLRQDAYDLIQMRLALNELECKSNVSPR